MTYLDTFVMPAFAILAGIVLACFIIGRCRDE
jgi:hypothetical protein